MYQSMINIAISITKEEAGIHREKIIGKCSFILWTAFDFQKIVFAQ